VESAVILDQLNRQSETIEALRRQNADLLVALDDLRLKLANATAVYVEGETTWTVPSAYAYAKACQALQKHKEKLAAAEASKCDDAKRELVKECLAIAKDRERYSWDPYSVNYASRYANGYVAAAVAIQNCIEKRFPDLLTPPAPEPFTDEERVDYWIQRQADSLGPYLTRERIDEAMREAGWGKSK
jgi:hypothetical protein